MNLIASIAKACWEAQVGHILPQNLDVGERFMEKLMWFLFLKEKGILERSQVFSHEFQGRVQESWVHHQKILIFDLHEHLKEVVCSKKPLLSKMYEM